MSEINKSTNKNSNETQNIEKQNVVEQPEYDLTKFRLTRILNNNIKSKMISLVGTFPHLHEQNAAIVLLEKKAFLESDVQTKQQQQQQQEEHDALKIDGGDGGSSSSSCIGVNKGDDVDQVKEQTAEAQTTVTKANGQAKELPTYFCNKLDVRCLFMNNIYGSFNCVPPQELSAVKATVVYPATEKHIEKYSIRQRFVINETPVMYENITLPYLSNSQFSIEWVYNILEHKQEVERIIYEDADPKIGFILIPDLKWDGKNLDTLYLLAIIHQHNIKSLRDLTAYHLPLLRNLRNGIAKSLEKRYGLLMSQLRIYFHYQPSFYHLHLHINPIRTDPPGIYCEKSHMLETVINNLELVPDYYQRVTIPFVLFDGSKLLELYEQEMTVRKRVKYETNTDDEYEKSEEIKKQQKQEDEQLEIVEDKTEATGIFKKQKLSKDVAMTAPEIIVEKLI